MAAVRSSTSLVGIALAVVIVVAVVVGIWRSVAGGAPDQPVGAPVPPAVSSTPPYEHHEDDGEAAEETPSGPPPTNRPSSGTDAGEHGSLPADQEAVVRKRATAFWKAFSVRDPADRDTALATVAVPYLAERMSVRSTSRIPVVTPVRSVIVDGTFSQATVVSEATGSSTRNNWWYVTLVFDPVPETWSAQAYEEASPGLIAAAKEAMKKSEGR